MKDYLSSIGISILIGAAIFEFWIYLNFGLRFFPWDPNTSRSLYAAEIWILPVIPWLIFGFFLFRDFKKERIASRFIVIFHILFFAYLADDVVTEWISELYRGYPYIQQSIVSIDHRYASGNVYQFLLQFLIIIGSAITGEIVDRIMKKKLMVKTIKNVYGFT